MFPTDVVSVFPPTTGEEKEEEEEEREEEEEEEDWEKKRDEEEEAPKIVSSEAERSLTQPPSDLGGTVGGDVWLKC